MTTGRTRRAGPRGSTLVELMITIAMLGVIASVATLAIRRPSPPVDDVATAMRRARSQAAESGRAIRVSRIDSGRIADFVVYPDGRVVADSVVHADLLTGRIAPAAR